MEKSRSIDAISYSAGQEVPDYHRNTRIITCSKDIGTYLYPEPTEFTPQLHVLFT
jgi:hypothetical protein